MCYRRVPMGTPQWADSSFRALLLLSLTAASGACGAGSNDDEVRLPVSMQSEPAAPTDFVITLRHVPPAGVECATRACRAREHWVADAQSRIAAAALVGCIRLDDSQWFARIRGEDRRMPATASDGAPATLSIRASPETPSRVVAGLIELLHQFTEIRRIEIAVDEPGIRGPSKLAVGSGVDSFGDDPIGVRVRIAKRRAAALECFVMRWFEEPFVPYPTGHGLPPEPDEPSEYEVHVVGRDALVAHLREWRVANEKALDRSLFQGVVAASDVPLQDAIEVFDALRSAGFDAIHLVSN